MTIKFLNKSRIFQKAWKIAGDAAHKFGGSAKAYFAESLKMAHRGECFISQREMARILDRAAGRSANPATAKQTWFLAGLLIKSGAADDEAQDYIIHASSLSKRVASDLIDMELSRPGLTARAA